MQRLHRPSAGIAATASVAAALSLALVAGSAAPALAAVTSATASSASSGSTVAGARVARPSATPTPTPAPVPVPVPTPTPVPVASIVPVPVSMDRYHGNTATVRTVTLRGTHLGHIAQVLIGGVAAPDLTYFGSKKVTFQIGTSPDFQPAVVPVSIVTDTGATLTTALTYTWLVRTKLDREMAYAGTHWNTTKNAVFGFLPGSDCTNYVSQLLLARGWTPSADWWNTWSTTGTWSATWASVTAMSDWLATRPDLATHLLYRDRDQAVVGDIVQINWDGVGAGKVWEHSAVVSRVDVEPDGTHDIYYTAHTTARLYGGDLAMLVKGYKHIRIQFWHLLQ